MRRKTSHVGECRLCRQEKRLLLSHFMPAAVFKVLREPQRKIKEPVLLTATVTAPAPRQMRDWLLCAECEDRLNKNGEGYVLGQMCHKTRFPLLEKLRVALNFEFTARPGVYSGPQVGVDTKKLAYFALSVVWRAAVHKWREPFGNELYSIDINEFEQPIAKFLLENSDFPADVAVIVTVCSDRESQLMAFKPTGATVRVPTPGSSLAVGFLACGIHFWVLLGPPAHPHLRNLCCFSSKRQLIFMRDIGSHSTTARDRLAATTRLSRSLQGRL